MRRAENTRVGEMDRWAIERMEQQHNEDTEKRALLVAMANDLAYVVQAVVSSIDRFLIVDNQVKIII